MPHRVLEFEVVKDQNLIRENVLDLLAGFDGANGDGFLAKEEETKAAFESILKKVRGKTDLPFFQSYSYLVTGLFQLLHYAQKELKAIPNADVNLKSAKANFLQVRFDAVISMNDFAKEISAVLVGLKAIASIEECLKVFTALRQIPFPIIYYTEYDPYSGIRTVEEAANNDSPFIPILSVIFTTDGQPWANPQVVKPKVSYRINGKVSINEWPAGYDRIVFMPVTTLPANSFEMNFAPIAHSNSKEFIVDGHVTFLVPQHSVDDTLAIRIVAYYEAKGRPNIFCTVIGYDQLLVKVLDPNSTNYPTGFSMMDQAINEINITLSQVNPPVAPNDKHNFLVLLSGILNYQGFCLQQGTYSGINDIAEDVFRDKLIQHLIAQPQIGEKIVKESHIGGGRVEISFHGIVAELKVERKISDRTKLYEKYGKQPVAYASANSKQLSILCVLDLTEKNRPVGVARNNITLHTLEVHGFEAKDERYPSKIAMIVIDGNTPKPSSYSK